MSECEAGVSRRSAATLLSAFDGEESAAIGRDADGSRSGERAGVWYDAGRMSDDLLKVAYVATGKLFLYEEGRGITELASPFVEAIRERTQRDRERNAWKDESAGWSMNAKMMPMAFRQGQMGETRRIEFTGLARGAAGELVYALDTNVTAGLFAQQTADKYERRLFHKQGFRARDLSRRADGTLAMSLRNEDGTASIAVMAAEGRGLQALTEGDVIDEQPAWVDGAGDVLVYQSAGIGRNRQGMPIATGPYSVVRMDTASGDVRTLVDRDGYDCLSPRMCGEFLYYIKRPYQAVQPVSIWRVGLDILLFPYRVIRALVHFLDFFSIMFARKPLITAGGPAREGPDQRYMMLWGKMIDAEKAMRQKKSEGALVPKDWELVRRELSSGREEVLARSVVSFDLRGNGVVFSNGSEVFTLGSDGAQIRVFAGKMIERVIVA